MHYIRRELLVLADSDSLHRDKLEILQTRYNRQVYRVFCFYTTMATLKLTNEDNMALMARYPDNHFELAIVDPPYGIGEDGLKNHSRGKATKATKYTPKNWDNSAPNKEYFKELQRVSKNKIIWGSNHFIENIPNANSSCWIVWDKDNSGDFADSELACSSFKTAVRNFKWRWNGMIQQDMKNKEARIHPTQKPVALYKWLLKNYAKEGDKILDTHLGSMSIAIACHEMGFDLTACELDKDYFDSGIQRVKKHLKQSDIFVKPSEIITSI